MIMFNQQPKNTSSEEAISLGNLQGTDFRFVSLDTHITQIDISLFLT